MGFSVSGSMVIVLMGSFVALSVFYGTASNTMERVTDARMDQRERAAQISGTDFNITSVGLLSGVSCGVRIEVNNTGSTKLLLNDTDLLLDNDYRRNWQADAVVESETTGDHPDSNLWLPAEQVTIEESGLDAAPRSVKVVSGPGVADTKEVTSLSCS